MPKTKIVEAAQNRRNPGSWRSRLARCVTQTDQPRIQRSRAEVMAVFNAASWDRRSRPGCRRRSSASPCRACRSNAGPSAVSASTMASHRFDPPRSEPYPNSAHMSPGCCLSRLDEDGARTLSSTLTEWLD